MELEIKKTVYVWTMPGNVFWGGAGKMFPSPSDAGRTYTKRKNKEKEYAGYGFVGEES